MKTLVAYYSRADENYFGGAMRYIPKGNTEKIAEKIKALTGGDLLKIEQKVPYARDYRTCIAEAKKDKERNARPEIVTLPENLDEYDEIYLGYPNYWGTMPMAVYTFLEHYDFKGKKIHPFCTHEGSGLSSTERDIQRTAKGAIVTKGLEYDCQDEEISRMQEVYKKKLWKYNKLGPDQQEEKQKYMHEVFAECGEDNYIEWPFHANWGGHNVHFGSHIYANSNLTLVDDTDIYVGSHTMFGPNVVVASAGHPIDPEKRRDFLEINKPVHIGENVWIGAGVVIVPGVSIGDNSIIGAGSVVVKDIPADVVAVGNPCKPIHSVYEKK